jgi:deazaflavin-dependent oxidoreductase (nitroreductase family)
MNDKNQPNSTEPLTDNALTDNALNGGAQADNVQPGGALTTQAGNTQASGTAVQPNNSTGRANNTLTDGIADQTSRDATPANSPLTTDSTKPVPSATAAGQLDTQTATGVGPALAEPAPTGGRPIAQTAANAVTSQDTGSADPAKRYLKPRRSTNLFNEMVAFLTRRGISVYGSRLLFVRGRKSGEWRSVPVNLLNHRGQRYLVAPRGHTQWVRNLRAAGGGELHVGRRVERFVPTELTDDQKPDILRAYLRRWKIEVGVFFDGVDAKAPDDVLRGIAPGYPVFLLRTADES